MRALPASPPLSPADWNFDSVPDHQLVACCYWEYARESTFLHAFKSRCVDANRNLKTCHDPFEFAGKDARRILRIGPVANSFLLGFGFPPDPSARNTCLTGNFPAPWLTLSPAERNYRARLAGDQAAPRAEPFARASGADAVNALLFLTDTIVDSLPTLDDRQINQYVQQRTDLFNEQCAGPALPPSSSAPPPTHTHPAIEEAGPPFIYRFQGIPQAIPPINPSTNPSIQPSTLPIPQPVTTAASLLRLDTAGQFADEITLVHLQWAAATDDQLVDSFRAWLKTNRPNGVRPGASRGHKLTDWRANLTRLAIMRLLTRFSALELIDPKTNRLPAIWETRQFSGPTWLDVVKWHDARREARHTFHHLFPFLPATDNPIAWPTAHHHS